MVSSVPTDPSMVKMGSVWNSQYFGDTSRISSAVNSAKQSISMGSHGREIGGAFTVKVDDGLSPLVGYPATFVGWKPFAGPLEQRCPSESSGTVHSEGDVCGNLGRGILNTR